MDENTIGDLVVDTAFKIHKGLGPGLLESVYEVVLFRELERKGLLVERQVPIPISYEGTVFEIGFRADIIVETRVILELKSVALLSDVHKKQLLTYLRLSNRKLGYLLNFGSSLMKDGIVRIINGNLSLPNA